MQAVELLCEDVTESWNKGLDWDREKEMVIKIIPGICL